MRNNDFILILTLFSHDDSNSILSTAMGCAALVRKSYDIHNRTTPMPHALVSINHLTIQLCVNAVSESRTSAGIEPELGQRYCSVGKHHPLCKPGWSGRRLIRLVFVNPCRAKGELLTF